MAGPIDPRTLAIIQAMAPAAEQRQAIMARDAVMRGSAPAPVRPAGLTIAPAPQMGMDQFADVRNPIPQPRGPMTAPQPSAADLMPPLAAGRMQPMPQSFETPIGPAPSRFVPPPMPTPVPAPAPAGNMLAPDIETGSIAPAPAPAAPAPGNLLEAPMPEPVAPGRRVYDPAAGTNQPRFIYEGGPAPVAAPGRGSAIATGGGAVPATGGAGGAAMPYSGGDSGGGMGDGFFDFLGGFSRGGLLGGIQGVHLGKKSREGKAAEAQKQQQGLNMTVEAARRLGIPNDMITALTATGNTKALADVIVDVHKQRMQPTDPTNRYKTVGGMIFDAETQQFIQPPEGAGNGPNVGLNPIYAEDADGNTIILQPTDAGTVVRPELPPGVRITNPTRALDTGTGYVTQDTRTGRPIGAPIDKNLAGAEEQRAAGKAKGEAAGAAPTQVSNADNTLTMIDEIRKHPARDNWFSGQGMASFGNIVPGTEGYDFQSRVEQLKGGAFLTAIQQMQGMGALSNQEGQTATTAITRLNTALSKEDFDDALSDYEAIVRLARERAAKNLRYDGKPMEAGGAPAAAPTNDDPLGIR